ncbi:glycolate oxidase [Quadrisphaera granulorum]|uniref:Glycolate oxidase n=1 Tax=Quadrisphaera granulorum TaxID=317664 RepID=A0A315ZRX5_9ACTN|nr:FAD-linked oxidase C-terminal domain-containing protein [Quadrisphaera granulorum]PWJ48301.1 glycolate oxidase [Quadrisphaera granulorum]SZE98462.1 glycolate oxidase [Quadrisphaera granulorum]
MTSTTTGVEAGVDTSLVDGLVADLSDWSVEPTALQAARRDRSGVPAPGDPAVVVRARSVAEVQHTARWCSATRTPLVVRGAGSGLAGAATAGAGVVVLDLSRLDRIVEVDPVDQVAVVEAGVVTAALDAAAAEHGLMYAPDPGSVGISTIGGNIATNAGGLRGAKHGVTREAVLALDVVLADGRLIHVGRRTLKGVTGYDLVGLFTGSEGTLGVVVGATLRLLPRPAAVATALATFTSVAAAAAAASAVVSSGVRPLVLELVDGATLGAIDALAGTALQVATGPSGAVLVAQTDGSSSAAARGELDRLAAVLTPLALTVEATDDAARAEQLLTARRAALPAVERRGRVLIEDIAVPLSRLAEAVEGVQGIAAQTGTEIYVLAHAADGNLHPLIAVPGGSGEGQDEAPLPPQVLAAADAVFDLALRLGGTVTGEHGVGSLKREHAARELGPDVVELQHQLKAVLDPSGILNPHTTL